MKLFKDYSFQTQNLNNTAKFSRSLDKHTVLDHLNPYLLYKIIKGFDLSYYKFKKEDFHRYKIKQTQDAPKSHL